MYIKIKKFLCLLKNNLFKNLDIIYTIVILTIKAINYNKLISPTFFSVHFIFQAIFSSVVVACSISLLFKPKGRIRFLYIFNLVISILLIADSAYYRYFKDCISLSVIRNGILLSGVSSSLKDLLKPNDFIYILVGGSLYNLILVFSYNLPLYRILNQDIIAAEILNSLAGSLGLLFTVPITAVTASLLCNTYNFKKLNLQNKKGL